MDSTRLKDGFKNEKLLRLPKAIIDWTEEEFFPNGIYISNIGYFPNAQFHFWQWKDGCEDNILFYCVAGKGYYTIGGKEYTLSAGQYVIIPSTSQSISYLADQYKPWTIYWVHFTGNGLSSFNCRTNIKAENGAINIPHNAEGILVWNKMYNSLASGYTKENILKANMCLEYFIGSFIFFYKDKEISEGKNIIVDETIDFMKNNLGRKLFLPELASRHNISPSYFSKLFKASQGISPIDFLIHLKMQKASQLLATTNMLIKEIADTLGYDDVYFFSRIFKQNNQQSPESYRQMIRKIYKKQDGYMKM